MSNFNRIYLSHRRSEHTAWRILFFFPILICRGGNFDTETGNIADPLLFKLRRPLERGLDLGPTFETPPPRTTSKGTLLLPHSAGVPRRAPSRPSSSAFLPRPAQPSPFAPPRHPSSPLRVPELLPPRAFQTTRLSS